MIRLHKMKQSDRDLGMGRRISRRDFVHGVGAVSTAGMFPGPLFAAQDGNSLPLSAATYPPALTGLRGNHDGAFDAAHQLAREGRQDWGTVQDPDAGDYDLVVVGGGISGLCAAHFYRAQNPQARILILDNHDDFGGHAKRNEFDINGRTLIGYGGSQTLQAPSEYSRVTKGLLDDLGVDIERFDKAYDQDFYRRHGLGGGIHFNKSKWGADRLVPFELGIFEDYLRLSNSAALSAEAAVAQMPISAAAKSELLHLLTTEEDQIPEFQGDDKWTYLESISYRDFLLKHMAITEPEVLDLLQDLAIENGLGIEAITAASGIYDEGLPGLRAVGLADDDDRAEPYIHHFPDGNASVARLLVRKMIPEVALGSTMDDIVTARFDYSKLDQMGAAVRIRLNSTVNRVQHIGETDAAQQVRVFYVRDAQAYQVQAHACVLACDNSIIPYLCPELPLSQREALAKQVKVPILYTNVALNNWRAWKKMGIGAVVSPGSYHTHTALDFPVSLGDYEFSSDPDEPIVAHMERFPHVNNQGLTAMEQHRLGRHELLSTPFETIERNVRVQLASMLGEAGFDPATDIAGITVNRWAHGYAHWYSPLFDADYADYDDERYPHMIARKPFGRIAIANADSAANAMFEAAVEQAHRAVSELT